MSVAKHKYISPQTYHSKLRDYIVGSIETVDCQVLLNMNLCRSFIGVYTLHWVHLGGEEILAHIDMMASKNSFIFVESKSKM